MNEKENDEYNAYICDEADMLLAFYAMSGVNPVHVNYCNKCMYCSPKRKKHVVVGDKTEGEMQNE